MSKATLNPAELVELSTELDGLRARVAADIGERDALHIRKMVRNARVSAAGGRGLLMFGFDPITWVLGVIALAHAKILENMEVGHNVLHGQYDWMNDETLNSQKYEWDIVCHSSHWRRTHNFEHHSNTNILGVDDDYGYGMLRMTGAQKWTWKTLFQPLWYTLLAIYFQWGVAIQHLKLGRWAKGRMAKGELAERSAPFLKKARAQLFKDYVLFPLIAFWNIPRVLLGNAAANLIRSLWTNAIIFCGHFTTHAQVFSKAESANESRGEWYLRQIQGSSNLEGSRWFHIMTGHLSHQIEHHIFPDIPAPRYAEIAPEVRAICAKYGIHYNSAGFWTQYGSVLWRICKYALPVGRRAREVPQGLPA
jgi:linoleoyl-CoA desaturase